MHEVEGEAEQKGPNSMKEREEYSRESKEILFP